MENITHTLVGALLGKGGGERVSRWATPLLIVSANAPDLDAVSMIFGEEAYFRFHRGVAHSFFGFVWLAGVLALGAWLWERRDARSGKAPTPWITLYLLSLVGLCSHLALDYANSYGIRPWLPFSSRWHYGDLFFVVDPWIWLILGGPLFCLTSVTRGAKVGWGVLLTCFSAFVLLAYRGGSFTLPMTLAWLAGLFFFIGLRKLWRGKGGRSLALGSLVLLSLYAAALLVCRQSALALTWRFARSVFPAAGSVSVFPRMGKPLAWRSVLEGPDRLVEGMISLRGPRPGFVPLHAYPKPALPGGAFQAIGKTRAGRTFLDFARYKEVRVAPEGPDWLVVMRDLRFDVTTSFLLNGSFHVLRSGFVSGFRPRIRHGLRLKPLPETRLGDYGVARRPKTVFTI